MFKFFACYFFFASFNALGQEEFKRVSISCEYQKDEKLYPADLWRDSLLKQNQQIELHIAENISGNFTIKIDDSIYFSGKIAGDPKSGFSSQIILLHAIQGTESKLLIQNLDSKTSIAIKLDPSFPILSLYAKGKHIISAVYSRKRPFRG